MFLGFKLIVYVLRHSCYFYDLWRVGKTPAYEYVFVSNLMNRYLLVLSIDSVGRRHLKSNQKLPILKEMQKPFKNFEQEKKKTKTTIQVLLYSSFIASANTFHEVGMHDLVRRASRVAHSTIIENNDRLQEPHELRLYSYKF